LASIHMDDLCVAQFVQEFCRLLLLVDSGLLSQVC
jgi:hypothetical protein